MPSDTPAPRILALETSSTSGSLALADESGRLLAQRRLPRRPRVAQTLIPAIDEMFRAAGWRPSDVGLVAVVHGPGSFTGLRVGVTAAKTFAYALRIDLLGVDTLEVLAWQAFRDVPALPDTTDSGGGHPAGIHGPEASAAQRQTPEQEPAGEPESSTWIDNVGAHAADLAHTRRPAGARVHAVLDAQRGELYQAAFACSESGGLQRESATRIVDPAEWLATVPAADLLTGSGLERVPAESLSGRRIVPQRLWDPRAAVVAHLARHAYLAGRRDDYWKLTPRYYRQSAAEEKAARP